LVHKAGLVELVADDRATLLGALLELAGRLREGKAYGSVEAASPDHLQARWRHAGLRAFHAEREAAQADPA